MHFATSFAILAALPGAVLAWQGFNDPSSHLPISANDTQWTEAVERSNSTAIVSFFDRDVTAAFPGTHIFGWVIKLTSVNLAPYQMAWDLKLVAPRTSISNAPKDTDKKTVDENANGQIVAATDDWAACALVSWGSGSLDPKTFPKDAPTDQKGICSAWLPKECISALENSATAPFKMFTSEKVTTNGGLGRRVCAAPELPKACEGLGLNFTSADQITDLPLRYLSGATTRSHGWELGGSGKNNLSPANVPKIWTALNRHYVAVLTTFGQYKEGDTVPGYTKLSCLRAAESPLHNAAAPTMRFSIAGGLLVVGIMLLSAF